MTGPWRRQLILVPLGYVTELNAFADPEVSPYNPLTKQTTKIRPPTKIKYGKMTHFGHRETSSLISWEKIWGGGGCSTAH